MSPPDDATSGGGHAPDEDVLLARAYLSRVSEPGSVPLWGFVERVGPIEAARAIRAGRAPAPVAAAAEARREAVDHIADLEAAERWGVRLLYPESPDWPHFALGSLHRLALERLARYEAGDRRRREGGEHVPPLALWVKGPADPAAAAIRSVAVVGARACTAYGEHVTADLGYGLARAGMTVVSGGAHGIDAAAHRAALCADGEAWLISAGGLDRPYPPGNAALFDEVAARGLLISESPPGVAPHRHRFLARNRLIACFGTATLVVEAGTRSGAGNTAAHAAAMGRPVLAVPGPVTSPMSAGCHALLRRPETGLVTSVPDVLAVVGRLGETRSEPAVEDPAHALRRELDDLDPTVRRVFEALPARRGAHPDDLAQRSGLSVVDVLRALPTLEHADLLEAGDAGYRLAARVRRSRPAVSA